MRKLTFLKAAAAGLALSALGGNFGVWLPTRSA